MSGLTRRLSDLEKAAAPRRPQAFVVWDDGEYSQHGKPITAAEYARLQEVCDVTLIRIVHEEAGNGGN